MSGYEDSEVDENGKTYHIRSGECEECDMAYRCETYDAPGADDCHKVKSVIDVTPICSGANLGFVH